MIAILDLFGYKKSIEMDTPRPIIYMPFFKEMYEVINFHSSFPSSVENGQLAFRLEKKLEDDVYLYVYSGFSG